MGSATPAFRFATKDQRFSTPIWVGVTNAEILQEITTSAQHARTLGGAVGVAADKALQAVAVLAALPVVAQDDLDITDKDLETDEIWAVTEMNAMVVGQGFGTKILLSVDNCAPIALTHGDNFCQNVRSVHQAIGDIDAFGALMTIDPWPLPRTTLKQQMRLVKAIEKGDTRIVAVDNCADFGHTKAYALYAFVADEGSEEGYIGAHSAGAAYVLGTLAQARMFETEKQALDVVKRLTSQTQLADVRVVQVAMTAVAVVHDLGTRSNAQRLDEALALVQNNTLRVAVDGEGIAPKVHGRSKKM